MIYATETAQQYWYEAESRNLLFYDTVLDASTSDALVYAPNEQMKYENHNQKYKPRWIIHKY